METPQAATAGDPRRSEPNAEIALAGARLQATPWGALWWAEESVLVVADLHLEKGSALARRGAFLPPYDTADTLARLSSAIEACGPRTVVALGDSFHDGEGPGRLAPCARAALAALMCGRDWVWIAGNHDPEPPAEIGGDSMRWLRLAGLTFRHEPALGAVTGEVAGHLHPAARIRVRGRSIRRRCYVADGARLVMPAFGAYAGGLNILGCAFRALFSAETMNAVLLGDRRAYPVAPAYLVGD